ncbi:MAG: hypothetical protein HC865_19070 [Cyanobacteria bacterium RU_5_0]|nr:hypothetical protein [Cyanobacteria bacterium RU_5_0]
MTNHAYLQLRRDAEYLYAHLFNLRRIESPDALIDRFRRLFIESVEYPELGILAALHRIATSTWAEHEFKFVLNRCCYILINYWWLQAYWWLDPKFKQATVELIALIASAPTQSTSSLATERLRQLVNHFTQTDQYTILQRRAWLAEHKLSSDPKTQTVGSLIHRYPFLYPYYVMDWDSSETGHQVVRRLQTEREQQFERDLLRYTTHLLRKSNQSPRSSLLVEVENPTLLTPRQLESTIRQFAGKVEGSRTYRDTARQFIDCLKQTKSYRDMKGQIYDYLTTSIRYSKQPDYGEHYFNRWLSTQLENMLPQRDILKPNSFLLIQTCGYLIDALIANPFHKPNDHVIFVDLINNLQATWTIGLLLKLALVCELVTYNLDAIKSTLAKRFTSIFRYYESRVRGDVEWLVECLENLMVALSIHFGQGDFYFSWASLL